MVDARGCPWQGARGCRAATVVAVRHARQSAAPRGAGCSHQTNDAGHQQSDRGRSGSARGSSCARRLLSGRTLLACIVATVARPCRRGGRRRPARRLPPVARRNGPLFEVAIRPGTPVLREWAVVCDSPTFAACLVGIEQLRPRRAIDSQRVFEAMWTVEPLAVREAARAGFALAVDRHPVVADALGSRLQEPVRATYDSIRTATVVTNRIIVYLERYA